MPRRQITYSSHPTHRARMVHAQGERQFRTYDTSHIRPKKSKAPMVAALVLVAVVVIVAAFAIFNITKGCSKSGLEGTEQVVASDTQVTIPEGASATDVSNALASAGVSVSADAFLDRAKELGADQKFQAGTYSFSAGMTVDQVVQAIASGDLGGYSLTIPEGYKLSDIASAVESATNGSISAANFSAAASDASAYAADYDFLKDAGTNSLEGFLFPKTYQLSSTDTADTVVRMMLDQFRNEISALDWSYPESKGLSIYDAVNLASIVEKESSGDEQIRSQVAAVFYNRLRTRRRSASCSRMQPPLTKSVTTLRRKRFRQIRRIAPMPTPDCLRRPFARRVLTACRPCALLRIITETTTTSSSGRTTRVRRSMRSAKPTKSTRPPLPSICRDWNCCATA